METVRRDQNLQGEVLEALLFLAGGLWLLAGWLIGGTLLWMGWPAESASEVILTALGIAFAVPSAIVWALITSEWIEPSGW